MIQEVITIQKIHQKTPNSLIYMELDVFLIGANVQVYSVLTSFHLFLLGIKAAFDNFFYVIYLFHSKVFLFI
ncbi:hypothetical protein DN401_29600 [Bacillus sp. BF2-3]|nr:hypothetical protein DN401_29600 [Bacillus sp. BF2-3]